MKQQITLTIASRDYVITIEDDEFYRRLERDLGGFKNNTKFLSPKELLDCFVQTNYDSYEDEMHMLSLIGEIDKRLKQ
ncbi:MAG: hypothetical protein K5978_00195 [Campylobacter sp.]|nr:hypothetical protein [Campylobacter sp.]